MVLDADKFRLLLDFLRDFLMLAGDDTLLVFCKSIDDVYKVDFNTAKLKTGVIDGDILSLLLFLLVRNFFLNTNCI